MAKKNKRRKGSILPMLAIGVGIYLLIRAPRVVKPAPPTTIPPLPTGDVPIIQRLRPRLRIPVYL